MWIVQVLRSVTLEGSQVVCITHFPGQFLKDGPIALGSMTAKVLFHVLEVIVLCLVVVKQGVVDIDKEDETCMLNVRSVV